MTVVHTRFEDVAPMHRLVAMLDQKDQQIEIAGDQRNLAVATQQQSLAGRQREVTEPVAWQALIFSTSNLQLPTPKQPIDSNFWELEVGSRD
jgi:hypothetical protein